MTLLFLDTETYSEVDITRGTDLYTRAAECLIVTYALGDGPAKIWEPWTDPILPADLASAARDPGVTFVAHNAAFDRLILLRALHMDVPIERWLCTMAQASAHGLPGSLATLGAICGLEPDRQKLVDDGKLIDTFCVPQGTGKRIPPTDQPENWARFCAYAIRDTEVLRDIYYKLPTHNFAGDNLAVWHLDQRINERGFGFDSRLAAAAVEYLSAAKTSSDQLVTEHSDGAIQSATQRNKFLSYLRDRLGVDIDNLTAGAVRDWLEHDDLDPTVRLLLEQRLEAGKSSGSKYRRALTLIGPQDRIRHWCRWSGAGRTGRHSARGMQVHNLPRPAHTVRAPDGTLRLEPISAARIDGEVIPSIYAKTALPFIGPFEAAAVALRHTIVAAPGNELMAGDFKNIESVITAWIAGEQLQLTAFAAAFADPKNKSLDVYRIIAGKMLGKPPADVNEPERQMGKVAILAFGFGGGVRALVNMAIGYQLDLEVLPDIVLPTATEEQLLKGDKAWQRAFLRSEDFELERRTYVACDVLKQAFRTANRAIDQLRKDIDAATKAAVANKDGTVYHAGRCKIFANASFLVIELPSGRRLLYASPLIKKETVIDPDGGEPWTSSYITYSTARGRGWMRERAWAGLFLENMVQAVAADVLRAAMLRVHSDSMTVPAVARFLSTIPANARTALSLHVHDEVVLDVPAGSYPKARFAEVLTQRPSWAPDLPIAADIWINKRYGKR